MKLASLKAGRDGALIVVSRDLARYAPAAAIAQTLQAALERWAKKLLEKETLVEAELDELRRSLAAVAPAR